MTRDEHNFCGSSASWKNVTITHLLSASPVDATSCNSPGLKSAWYCIWNLRIGESLASPAFHVITAVFTPQSFKVTSRGGSGGPTEVDTKINLYS